MNTDSKALLWMYLLLMTTICHAQFNHVQYVDSIYKNTDNYKEIISYATNALKTNNLTDFNRIGLNYYSSASSYRLKDFTAANETINTAYTEIENLNPTDSSHAKLIIDICQRIGDFSFIIEDFEKGLVAMNHGISISEKHLSNDHWRKIKLLHKNGALHRIQGNQSGSKKHLDLALTYLDSISEAKRNYMMPAIKAEIAGWYNYNHEPKKAIKTYKELMQVAVRDSNYRRIDIYNNNISNSYQRLNDYGKALYYMQNSLKVKTKIFPDTHPKTINAYNNLATIYLNLDDLENAEKYWMKTEELIKKSLLKEEDQYFRLAVMDLSKGKAYLKRNEYERAILAFHKMLNKVASLEMKNEDEYASAQQLLGYAYGKIKEKKLAIKHLNTSIELRENMHLEQDYELGFSYLFLHEIYSDEGAFGLADQYLDNAFASIDIEVDGSNAIESTAIPARLVLFFKYQLISIANGLLDKRTDINDGLNAIAKSEKLIEFLKLSIDDYESRTSLQSKLEPLQQAISYFYIKAYESTKNSDYVGSLFETQEIANNVFLYQHIAEDASAKFGIPEKVIKEKNKLIEEYNDQKERVNMFKLDSNSEDHVNAIEILNSKKENIYTKLNEINLAYPNYYELLYNFPVTTLEKTKLLLKTDEVILQYFSALGFIYCLQIDSENTVLLQIGIETKISDKLNDLVECVVSKGNCHALQLSLYDTLIEPFRIENKTILNIVPGSIVGNVPFEILKNNEGAHLLETHQISYQYSSTLKSKKSNGININNKILAMAPVFDDEKPIDPLLLASLTRSANQLHLPNSLYEVQSIDQTFNGKMFFNKEATIDNFYKHAKDANVIHLATHGMVDQKNPNLSRLLFSSSDSSQVAVSLYADEISNLELNADLVTLSACNTGIGKVQAGEGISSLGRAFAYAGCDNQVISLWAVNDVSTTELMSLFYKNLKSGMTKPEAVQKAKLQYLKASPQALQHPYYWAGFVYYGDDEPIASGSQLLVYLVLGGLILVLMFLLGSMLKRSSRVISYG